jgi:MSHA pilin protein MshA
MNKQAGFTLVELVVVIVILGLLAATALPKFINVTNNARTASVQGVAGGLRSATSLARAQYVLDGSKTSTSITMDGVAVTVLAETGNTGMGGRPTGNSAGIEVAMPNPDGFTIDDTTTAGTVVYTPSGGGTTCYVKYVEKGSGDPVVSDVSGC